MQELITKLDQKYRKAAVTQVRSGDSVRVDQKVREGGKERVQAFEGTVIRTRNLGSLMASATVRRVVSGVGVEKIYLLHSPNVVKITVLKRGKVRRNYLTYMRAQTGKATRLAEQAFDKEAVNAAEVKPKEDEKPAKAEKSTKDEAEQPTDTQAEEPKPADTESKDDKAAAKKAKAEAFRKAQAAKK